MGATTHPLLYEWDGEAMVPSRAFTAEANRQFVVGERYRLAEVEDASEVSRRHQFAWLNEAWKTMPDDLIAEFPTAEHLRKKALIATGFCTTTDFVCGSKAEADRWGRNLRREVDEYAVVVVSGTVVRVFRAKSQKRGAMDRAEFQASKQALLEWVSAKLGVEPEQLERARAA